MESLKFRAKPVHRDNLYFGKYRYRVWIEVTNWYYARTVRSVPINSIEEFKKKLRAEIQKTDERGKQQTLWSWVRIPEPYKDTDFDIIEKLLNFREKYKATKEVAFRSVSDCIGIYTTDLAVISEALEIQDYAIVEEAIPAPAGVMHFAGDPPAKYRTYLSGKKVPVQFEEDMKSYLSRTPTINPSKSFSQYLKSKTPRFYKSTWLSADYYLDYDDQNYLLMMQLIFGEAIGKTFKLEKRIP